MDTNDKEIHAYVCHSNCLGVHYLTPLHARIKSYLLIFYTDLKRRLRIVAKKFY
eukprot:SAG31_NODE_389_length_16370_cov_4.517915_15_plen_54_part_00